ncbi:MAG: DUF4440 domain-containing protein [Candidatus Tectomicrobia bacterium]|uniref:DUF4440 domain-containing protein n=1 Tax=Tectimicrobiota bacterium TaxID=2528274 RepID=A0A933E817_UNCTE|nr:DUF4440 domain-containing protein [Candidatus Tectomicrobia bacterium]
MRALLVAAALITLHCSIAIAGPQEEALQVVEKWTRAFTGSDIDGIVKLYALDALVFGTSSKALVTKPDEIRKYFERALSSGRVERKLVPSIMVLSDTVVVVTGLETVTGVRRGELFNATGRVTFVVAKRGSGWQIAHFHRSRLPN